MSYYVLSCLLLTTRKTHSIFSPSDARALLLTHGFLPMLFFVWCPLPIQVFRQKHCFFSTPLKTQYVLIRVFIFHQFLAKICLPRLQWKCLEFVIGSLPFWHLPFTSFIYKLCVRDLFPIKK